MPHFYSCLSSVKGLRLVMEHVSYVSMGADYSVVASTARPYSHYQQSIRKLNISV